jgi:nitroreductase
MEAIKAITSRVSVQRVGGEAPSSEVRGQIYAAALRVPDHAQLKPWRFLEIEGESLEKLSDLFAKAFVAERTLQGNPPSEEEIDKARNKPLRAPLMIVVIASPLLHPKVPEVEQILSAGAAAQNMLIASHALGIGAMWRTGSMAYDDIVKQGLGLGESEHIVGFLYLGEPVGRVREAPTLEIDEYFQSWPMQS